MVEVLLDPDMDEIANTDGKVITILDPACGTGGMLSVAQNKMESLNSTTQVIPFGQELNPETYATCRSDMILKGNTNSRIVLGNSFNEDGFKSQTFDYMLSNPPFGVEWKKVEKFIKDEAASQGIVADLALVCPVSRTVLSCFSSISFPNEPAGKRWKPYRYCI